MLNATFQLQSVAVQAGTDTTYRVIAMTQLDATVIRCTSDNVVYPGALPRKVPMEQFQNWSAYKPVVDAAKHPDEF